MRKLNICQAQLKVQKQIDQSLNTENENEHL